MRKILYIGFYLLILMAFWVIQSWAQDMDMFIQEFTIGGVKYASGGIGADERRVMESMARDYNLKLEFAASTGPYLANVMVLIEDEKGDSVVDAESKGPWFLAKLQPGDYQISVSRGGEEQTRMVSVSEGMQMVRFFWKPSPDMQKEREYIDY